MNVTLKALCGFVKKENEPELQIAAARVIEALGTKEAQVARALGESLLATGNERLFDSLLRAVAKTHHEQSLRYLLLAIERDEKFSDKAIGSLIAFGSDAIPFLARQLPRADSVMRKAIGRVLTSVHDPAGLDALVSIFFDQDPDVVKDTLHNLREDIDGFPSKLRSLLHDKLMSAYKKADGAGPTAEDAIVIALGIVGDNRAKSLLLKLAAQEEKKLLQRHALIGLSRLPAKNSDKDYFDTLLPLLARVRDEDEAWSIIQVLKTVKPRRSDAKMFSELLGARFRCAKLYAVEALGHLDSPANVRLLVGLLEGSDRELCDGAIRSLQEMSSAVDIVLGMLDKASGRLGESLVTILEAHADSMDAKGAKALCKHMFELFDKGDSHYQLYRTLLFARAPGEGPSRDGPRPGPECAQEEGLGAGPRRPQAARRHPAHEAGHPVAPGGCEAQGQPQGA